VLQFNGWRWRQDSFSSWQPIASGQTIRYFAEWGAAISNPDSIHYTVLCDVTAANGVTFAAGGINDIRPGESVVVGIPIPSPESLNTTPSNLPGPYFFEWTWHVKGDGDNGGYGKGTFFCAGCIDTESCWGPVQSGIGCCQNGLSYCSSLGACSSNCTPPCASEGQNCSRSNDCCYEQQRCYVGFGGVAKCRSCAPIGDWKPPDLQCCDNGVYCPQDQTCHPMGTCCPNAPYRCPDNPLNGQCLTCITDGSNCAGACCNNRCADGMCRKCIDSGPLSFCPGAQCCETSFTCQDNNCRTCIEDNNPQNFCSRNGTSAPCCNNKCDVNGLGNIQCRSIINENERWDLCDKDTPCGPGLYKCADGYCKRKPPDGVCCIAPEQGCGYSIGSGGCQSGECGECAYCERFDTTGCWSCTPKGEYCNPPKECCDGLQRCADGYCKTCAVDFRNCSGPCCCAWESWEVVDKSKVGF